MTEKDLCWSLYLNHLPTLLEKRLWYKCFPLNSEIFLKPSVLQNASNDCFCYLKNYPGSIQNLPSECFTFNIYPLLQSFNHKNRNCRHYIIFSIFTEISGDKLKLECFQGFSREEISWYTSKFHNLPNAFITQLYFLDVLNWNLKVNSCTHANSFWR